MATAAQNEMDVVDAYVVLIHSLSDFQRNALIKKLLADGKSETKTRKSLRSLKGILSSDDDYHRLRSEVLEEKYGV